MIGLVPNAAKASTHVSDAVLATTEEHTSWAEVGGAALGGLFFLVLFLLAGAALFGVGRTVKKPSMNRRFRTRVDPRI